MRRATITLTDEIEERLERFLSDREPRPSLAAVLQAALTNYLDHEAWQARSFRPARGALRVSSAREGSGHEDTSLQHDTVMAARS